LANGSTTSSDENRWLSSTQVAKALGVSSTTVKRWIDDGLLSAHRTQGGHRRIPPDELLRLARSGQVPQLDLSSVQLAAHARGACGQESTHLKQYLLKGDRLTAQRLMEEKLLARGISALAEELITPAMQQIGIDWQTHKIEVMHEHRATELCLSILYQFVPMMERKITNPSRIAVGCSPTKDFHRIASLLAKMMLNEAGWKATHLGGGVSATVLEQSSVEMGAELVWISATKVPSTSWLVREFGPVLKRLRERGILICTGGQAISPRISRSMGANHHGSQLSDLIKMANGTMPS
jgi:MerR family transcriptional regulator, light-induced transcriptional regulator